MAWLNSFWGSRGSQFGRNRTESRLRWSTPHLFLAILIVFCRYKERWPINSGDAISHFKGPSSLLVNVEVSSCWNYEVIESSCCRHSVHPKCTTSPVVNWATVKHYGVKLKSSIFFSINTIIPYSFISYFCCLCITIETLYHFSFCSHILFILLVIIPN